MDELQVWAQLIIGLNKVGDGLTSTKLAEVNSILCLTSNKTFPIMCFLCYLSQ